ncbi:hypothetical protein F4804DRAFT_332705 [Jackrogersella minutella]|nr:hypothetical protein F4804DRAFT_332705 [Jackrogersella minutella]
MSFSGCGHQLPKSRIGANLAYIPRDASKRCPECQTKSPNGTIQLLKNIQKSHEAEKPGDPGISQHIMTYVFDRVIQQRKNTSTGFKQRLGDVIGVFGEVSYHVLERKQLASFIITTRGRWGSDIAKQALRAVGSAALKSNGVYAPIEPAEAEILTTLNRMITLFRGRAAAIETFEQLQIILDSAGTLRKLRDDVTSGLSKLEEGVSRWDTPARK